MSKYVKLISVVLIAVILVISLSNVTFAAKKTANELIKNVSDSRNSSDVAGTGDFNKLTGRIINFLQYAAIIGGTIILAVLGIKYMMGSVEEKAEYKKSFIPLIVGVVVVMGAVSIAKVIFQTFTL